MFNVLHLSRLVKVDLIVRKESRFRFHDFERRRRVSLPGFDAWIVSKEDLILSKLVWGAESGSELQRRDVRALLAGGADEAYLRLWAGELDVADSLQACLDGRHDA